tara:strand:+ start:1605 stop:2984 length:1380 start_codon:yes stop_codon:yes gene_type:complete
MFLASCTSQIFDTQSQNPFFDQMCNKYNLNLCSDLAYIEEIEIEEKETFDHSLDEFKNLGCEKIRVEESIEQIYLESKDVNYKIKKSIFQNFTRGCLEEIINYNDGSKLRKYSFCCSFFNTALSGQKSFAYFAEHEKNLIIGLGTGLFTYTPTENLLSGKIMEVSHIESNFQNLIVDNEIYNPSWFSIKDILIDDNLLLVSYTKEVKENCYNTAIIQAEFNYDYLQFSEFFSHEECVFTDNKPSFSGHSAGGKIVALKDNKYLFTTGEFLKRSSAQEITSNLGKTILLDNSGKKIKTVSLGHRNPQGLTATDTVGAQLLTEHGPAGGDEINLIRTSDENVNYGWPISSYGNHYGDVTIDGAPLYKSHKKYGFVEPIYYFYPSIGISAIEQTANTTTFMVSSLNQRRLYKIEFKNKLSEPSSIKRYRINERTRDLIYIESINAHVMSLEDTPYIGIFINN